MPIDWFTVVAQAFNFLILVWLLKRFLYRPILDAIDAREKRIAAELADAEAKKAEARQESNELTRRNEEFDQQRAALLNTAVEEAKAEHQRLLDEARKESDTLRAKWRAVLRNEHNSLSEALVSRTREEVFAIARKTLADLAATSLEERMTDVFLRRLHELGGTERDRLKSAFEAVSDPVIVRTAFDLSEDQRRAIEDAVKDMLAVETQVRFETAPELVSGIALTAGGYKVAWSIGNYLASLEKSVEELLREPPTPAADTVAHPEPGADEHGA